MQETLTPAVHDSIGVWSIFIFQAHASDYNVV